MNTSTNYKILTEEPNTIILNELLNDNSLPNDVHNIISKYKKNMKHNKIKIQYKQKYNNIGRYWCSNNDCISFTNMPCELRNTLADGIYYDVDMVNSLPYLCYNICRKHKLPRKTLKKYIIERTNLLQELQDTFTIEKWKCKNLINRIMNGGGIKKWYEEWDINTDLELPPWVYHFKDELSIIYNSLYDIYYEDYKVVIDKEKTEYENKVRIVSIMLQDKENDLLQIALEYCDINKYVVGAMIYDGFLLKATDDFDIDDLTDYVNNNYEYPSKWAIKPMDEKIIYNQESDEKDDDWTFDESMGYEFDASYCMIIKGVSPKQTYKRRQKYFENFVIQTYSPEILFHIRNYRLNIITTYKRPELTIRFEDVYSGLFSDSNGREFKFLEIWLSDHTKRKGEIYNWVPMNPSNNKHLNKLSPNAYNIWTGYSREINMDYNNPNILELWKEVVHNLCGGVKEYTHYYTCFLAQIVQDPANKKGIAIGFKSEQGEGKGLHLQALSRVIGLEHYYTSEKMEQIFGNHSEAFAKKLLVNIDETHDTHKYIDSLKTKITEPYTPLNIKFQREIMVENFTRIIFTQNNNNLSFDTGSGDRRFVMFESNHKNLKYKNYNRGWEPIANLWATPEHIKSLYEYLNNYNIDIDLINDRPITELYKQLLQKNKPMILEFMTNWIDTCKWRDHENYYYKNENDANNITSKEYDDYFNTPVQIKCPAFQKDLITYLKNSGIENPKASTQDITAKFNNYNLPIKREVKRKENYFCFTPKEVFDYMTAKGFNNIKFEENKPKEDYNMDLFKLY